MILKWFSNEIIHHWLKREIKLKVHLEIQMILKKEMRYAWFSNGD